MKLRWTFGSFVTDKFPKWGEMIEKFAEAIHTKSVKKPKNKT